MAEQFGERRHEATQHRRQQAREEGNVAKSQDLASAALLVAALGILRLFGERLTIAMGTYAHRYLGDRPELVADQQWLSSIWYMTVLMLAQTLLPIFALVFVVAIFVNMLQTGILFLPKKLSLDVSRINPAKGIKRIVSLQSAVRLGFGIIKILVVGGVAGACLWAERDRVVSASELAIPQLASLLADITIGTCLKVGFALLALALLDYFFQRWKHEQDLMMTDQELREEFKNQQGDPQIMARRRAVQREMMMNRMDSTVPGADVVVTNPTELAVAIRYDPETMAAPMVVAKGAGVVAQRIRRLALEHQVPIVERKELARALYKEVEVNQEIPAQQYAAMAEVLRYVYELKGKSLPGAQAA